VAESLKVLGQLASAATTLEDLYTVPGGTSAVVSTLTVCNRSATPTTFRVAVRPAGAAINNKHYVGYDLPLGANEVYGFTIGMTLAATDVVSIYAAAATVSSSLFGTEVT
jgi:hypothetical protein